MWLSRNEHLSISYNGGKDCLVLLILILACLPAVYPPPSTDSSSPSSSDSSPQPLKALYIVSSKPFQEVEDFVAATSAEYHLDLDRYATKMRPALEVYLTKRPEVEAIFMGTRRTDPHAEALTHFDMTDPDWPQFMRVHPVIDWHYVEIWAVSFDLNPHPSPVFIPLSLLPQSITLPRASGQAPCGSYIG